MHHFQADFKKTREIMNITIKTNLLKWGGGLFQWTTQIHFMWSVWKKLNSINRNNNNSSTRKTNKEHKPRREST